MGYSTVNFYQVSNQPINVTAFQLCIYTSVMQLFSNQLLKYEADCKLCFINNYVFVGGI